MLHQKVTRRRVQAPTGFSEMFSDGNCPEDSNTVLARQAARIEARFAVSCALAKTIAEHAYSKGVSR